MTGRRLSGGVRRTEDPDTDRTGRGDKTDEEKEGNKLAEEPLTKAKVTLLFGIFFTAGYSASKKTLWRPMPPVEPRLLPHLVPPTTGDPP